MRRLHTIMEGLDDKMAKQTLSMKELKIHRKRRKCGETLAEALVTFLIATISTIVLASAVFVSVKLVGDGEESSDIFFGEENELDRFIYGLDIETNNGDKKSKIISDKITIIAEDNSKTTIGVLAYKTESYSLIGFRNE